MFRTIIIALALTVSAAQAGTATVRFGDLDLSSSSGTDALAGRVQTASRTVCDQAKPGPGQDSLYYRQRYAACLERAGHLITLKVMAAAGQTGTRLATK